MSTLVDELRVACAAARAAGALILAHYDRGGAAGWDKADGSPVTRADLDADHSIAAALGRAFPGDGLLSEERADDRARLAADRVWIVDPIDGTRDFIARSGDFSVHIGLAIGGRAVLGVVYQPVGDALYHAVAGEGAFGQRGGGPAVRLAVSAADGLASFRLGVSRFAPGPRLGAFLAEVWAGRSTVAMGASTKMMAIARGDLEVALWLTDRENEWDTCAPEVIVREAGGAMTDVDGRPFVYNRPEVGHRRGILASNGRRHAELAARAGAYLP